MKETFETDACGRSEQLVGYLYGEASADERANFEQHLAGCAVCRDELAAFGQVRRSVADWRAQVLDAAPAVPLASLSAEGERAARGVASSAATPRSSGRTAWAALGEFFALSPAWLRASTLAAALSLCVLATLAVVNAEVRWDKEGFAVRTGTRPAPARADSAPTPAPAADPSAELAALQARLSQLTAERDAAVRELEDTRAQLDDSREINIAQAAFGDADRSATSQDGRRQRRTGAAPAKRNTTGVRNTRRAVEDEDLPRLLDLLTDAN